MRLRILYFAWFRERVGVPGEEVETEAETVSALIGQLRASSERHGQAFSHMAGIRVAVDQKVCPLDASLEGASEVAFFPPMTGG
ncbi:MAG: molybdopterin converting factor subunit 1 [Rhodobacteraceae bacterium]|nr:molybdopterin converting factor subunit 1 [Paracoccaceae bacterium]